MKKIKRILAVIFCCLFVFLVGCDEILEDNGVSVKAFDGVKVLSRPTDYFDNIGEVVGDKASEFYYNIFDEIEIKIIIKIYIPILINVECDFEINA